MNQLDKIYLDTLNTYLFNISYLAARPGERRRNVDFYFADDLEPFNFVVAYATNRACLLTRCNELINDLDLKEADKLEDLIDKSIRFQQLNWTNADSKKRKQYRNGIAHGNLSVNKDTGMLHIYNSDFEADIPIYEFSSLVRLYYVAYGKLKDNYLDFCISNLKAIDNIRTTNTKELIQAINQVKVLEDSIYNHNNFLAYVDKKAHLELGSKVEMLGDNYSNKGTIITESIDLSYILHCKQLDEDKQDELFNYIKYIANWDKLNRSEKYQYLRNFVNHQLGNSKLPIEYEEINALLMPIMDLFQDLRVSKEVTAPILEIFDELSKRIGWKYSSGYKAYGYIINLINAVYFCFGYLAERFKNQYPSLYTDYDLTDFDVDESLGISNLNTYLEIINSRSAKIADANFKQQKSLEKIARYKAAGKEALALSEQQVYDARQIKIDNYQQEVDMNTYYSKDVRNDEANFLKKIRNSLTHGFYSIDYNSGFERKDVSKTIITFEDMDTKKDSKINFRVTITARSLVSLLKQFREKLADCLDEPLVNKQIVYSVNKISIR